MSSNAAYLQGIVGVKFNPTMDTVVSMPMKRFEIVESVYDGCKWKLTLPESKISFWEDLAVGSEKQFREFQLQYGISGTINGVSGQQLSEFYPVVVLKSGQTMTLTGADACLVGSDQSLNLKAQTRTTIWKTNLTAIVTEMAQDYGLIPVVDTPLNEASGDLVYYAQYGESDWGFLNRLCRTFVSSVTGTAGYCVWVSKGKYLNVRPPFSTTPPTQVLGLSEGCLRFNRVKVRNRRKAAQIAGGLGGQVLGFNTLTKSSVVLDKDYTNYSENIKLAPYYSSPTGANSPGFVIRSVDDNENNLYTRLLSALSDRSTRINEVEMEIIPVFENLEVGDTVNVDLSSGGKKNTAFSGNYVLSTIHTILDETNVRMKIKGFRVGEGKGELPLLGLDMSKDPIIIPEGKERSAETI